MVSKKLKFKNLITMTNGLQIFREMIKFFKKIGTLKMNYDIWSPKKIPILLTLKK